ncbi:MAG: FAD-dependent oxidoreductase [Rubrivivax sp.]|nr:FAD-dependent oxidoreductase [Rubrivivax sp.]
MMDLAVIGAGPAGLAAATLAAQAGLDTVLFDEGPAPGGQIYRAVTRTPLQRRDTLGADYWHGQSLVKAFEASGARLEAGCTVWSLDPELELGVLQAGAARMVQARRVVIATGALERPFPIPGWTLPGVMTVGAGQTLLKSAGLVPEGQVVLAGCGPLLWLYAAQCLRAGGRIAMLLDTTPRAAYLRRLGDLPAFIASPLLAKGLALMAEVKRAVVVVKHVTDLAVAGDERVRELRYRCGTGPWQSQAADTVLLHQGVVPNVNLAMAAGVHHEWDGTQLCWRPQLDGWGQSSIAGLAIAGDGAGIAGAWAAEERGRLAGIAAVRALKGEGGAGTAAAASTLTGDDAERNVRQALARHERGRAYLDAVFQPAPQFRLPEGDTLVCRCEEVSAAQIKATVAQGCEGPNQLKAFLRCGMGPCQGRLCGLTVTELIARERGVTPAQVGYYRIRPPVKPIALAALAQMPVDDAAVKAVVRG